MSLAFRYEKIVKIFTVLLNIDILLVLTDAILNILMATQSNLILVWNNFDTSLALILLPQLKF